jgi:hypothetical protein
MKKAIIVVASLGFWGLAGYFIYKKVTSHQSPVQAVTYHQKTLTIK